MSSSSVSQPRIIQKTGGRAGQARGARPLFDQHNSCLCKLNICSKNNLCELGQRLNTEQADHRRHTQTADTLWSDWISVLNPVYCCGLPNTYYWWDVRGAGLAQSCVIWDNNPGSESEKAPDQTLPPVPLSELLTVTQNNKIVCSAQFSHE